jgi:hypothetical protein
MIKDVLTEPGQQAGRNVNASVDSPRYEVGHSFPVVAWNTDKRFVADRESEHRQNNYHLRKEHHWNREVDSYIGVKMGNLGVLVSGT